MSRLICFLPTSFNLWHSYLSFTSTQAPGLFFLTPKYCTIKKKKNPGSDIGIMNCSVEEEIRDGSLVTQSSLTCCNPTDLPARLLCPQCFSRQEYLLRCHDLLQGSFPTHGSNSGLPHCTCIPYCLSHQRSSYKGEKGF